MDLGPCPKTHSDRILKQFKEAQEANPNDPRINAFRQEHENNIYQFVDECDRRIRASQRKLEKTPEENRKTVDLMREIGEIELSIQGGTEEIEASVRPARSRSRWRSSRPSTRSSSSRRTRRRSCRFSTRTPVLQATRSSASVRSVVPC
jgi:hypothetical protein